MVEVVPDMTVGVLKEQLKTFPADSLETFFLKLIQGKMKKPTVSKFFSWSKIERILMVYFYCWLEKSLQGMAKAKRISPRSSDIGSLVV